MEDNADRWSKLEDLRAAGRDPFRANCPQDQTSRQAIEIYREEGSDERARVAGRITVIRRMGRASFA
jgi:lysyl-tRNA synthetase class 2